MPTALEFDMASLVAINSVFFDTGVKNVGNADAGEFNVSWLVNGEQVAAGDHEGVAANATILDGNSQFTWVAVAGTHTISFVVDTSPRIAESNEANNAISVEVVVPEPVLEGDFTIRSQEDLDGLIAATGDSPFRIRGSLSVMGSPLVNLKGLEHLTGVEGNLAISVNPALTSLDSLANLTNVEGEVTIIANAALTSLAGLENLARVRLLSIRGNSALPASSAQALADRLIAGGFTGQVTIEGNKIQVSAPTEQTVLEGNFTLSSQEDLDELIAATGNSLFRIRGSLSVVGSPLVSLEGLDTLTGIEGDLWVYNNDSLTSLKGLQNLTIVEGDLLIDDNEALTSLAGPENVTRVGRDLGIRGNRALTSLSGLENLTTVGSLGIINNGALTSLAGLENLNSLEEQLFIVGNGALTSLAGLNTLTRVERFVRFSGNSVLPTSSAQALADRLRAGGVTGRVTIEGNKP